MKTPQSADIKFLLKDPRATAPTLISLVYRYNNQRFVYSTGQSVEPYQWDAAAQRAHTSQTNKTLKEQHRNLNAVLDRHRAALVRVLGLLQVAGVMLDNATLKQHLDSQLDKSRPAKKEAAPIIESFTDFITRFVEEAEAGKRLNAKSGRFAPGTLTNFKKVRNIVTTYQSETRQRLTNDAYTLSFYESLKIYLVSKGHSLNYIGSVLYTVKTLLGYAYRDGLAVPTDYQQEAFRKLQEQVDKIYLSDAELTTLYSLDLTKSVALERVRDLFLIGAYTGLRFSNFTQIRPANLNADNSLLTVQMVKGGRKTVVPLNDTVRAILTKYNGVLPRALTNQKFNDALKTIGERAKLTELIEYSRTQGGQRITLAVPKWELLTTHTARRSFATNAYRAGVPTLAVMKITGHRTETQFMKYIKISEEENARLMLQHPHFAGTPDVPAPQVI